MNPTPWTSRDTMWLIAALIVIVVGVRYAPELTFPVVGLIVVYLALTAFPKTGVA